jgi:hypothetical protein
MSGIFRSLDLAQDTGLPADLACRFALALREINEQRAGC